MTQKQGKQILKDKKKKQASDKMELLLSQARELQKKKREVQDSQRKKDFDNQIEVLWDEFHRLSKTFCSKSPLIHDETYELFDKKLFSSIRERMDAYKISVDQFLKMMEEKTGEKLCEPLASRKHRTQEEIAKVEKWKKLLGV